MTVAIIGGSGLFGSADIKQQSQVDKSNAYGMPSGPIQNCTLRGQPALFLARHGRPDQHIPPHKINYRANLQALKDAGATAVVTVNIVGGISAGPGSWVVPDQIIDYTWGREHTYSDGSRGQIDHVDFTEPYDGTLSSALVTAASDSGVHVVRGGVYGCTQGPRLESSAEVVRLERDGCDIVGMTAMPEAALARELGLPYAGLCLVVNWAAGKGEGEISFDEINACVEAGMPQAVELIGHLLPVFQG